MQRVEQLPLVFVDALDLHVEQPAGSMCTPVSSLSSCASRALLRALHREEASCERRIVGEQLQLAQAIEVGDPAVADALGDQRRERGVGVQQPAPRRDAVGLVVEALRMQP